MDRDEIRKGNFMKKRTLSWLMTAVLGVGALTGCIASVDIVFAEEQSEETEATGEETEEAENAADETDGSVMKFGAMKGPTAMGMAQLLDDENYDFSIVASPDEIVPMIVQGQVDVAAVPSNLASVLYQKTDKNVRVLVRFYKGYFTEPYDFNGCKRYAGIFPE